jgi:DNA-binding transcriptional MerR regulator
MFRIGDFSRLTHVSIKALRFYDEVGLLKPTLVDNATGYRYYSPDLISRMNRILAFKELGFSLDEIALLMREGLSPGHLRSALDRKREDLTRRIAHEQSRIAEIEAWLAQIEREGRTPTYEIALRRVAPQFVASIRESLSDYDDAAELFAQLDRHLKRHNPNSRGQRAAVWHACQGQADSIDCEALVLLDRCIPESKTVAVYELPSSINACLLHHGTDETITDAYVAAHSWIETNGYEIAGPLCELYWQGAVAKRDRPGVTEIRYPVLKSHGVASEGKNFSNN